MLPVLCVTGPQKEKNLLEAEEPLNPRPIIDPEPFAWKTASNPYSSFIFSNWRVISSSALSQVTSSNVPDPRDPVRFNGVLTLSGAIALLLRALPFTHGIKRGWVIDSGLFDGVSIRIISLFFTWAMSSQRQPQS
jgi:hypothetical protein